MAITVSSGLVPLVRDGLYFDLQGDIEAMAAVVRLRGRDDVRAVVETGLARAGGAVALFDELGWLAPEEERAVEVDVRRHREALMGALWTRVGSERSVQDDANASEDERAQARAREGQLAELAASVGGALGVSMVVVPASLVDLLREALVSALADCAGKIDDGGREHPGDLNVRLLARFDAYRALLEEVGLQSAVPAVAVQVDLSVHRRALVGALRRQRDCERFVVWAVDAARSRRTAARIDEFMSATGLQDAREDGAAASAERDCAAAMAWECA